MGIIRDFYDKGEKTINDIIKKYQNPLKEFEKEIDNLKLLLKESKSLAAHINALRIRADKDIIEYREQAKKYQQKAESTISELNAGKIPEKVAEQVSITSLKMKKTYENRVEELTLKIPVYDKELEQVKEKIEELKTKITHYEKEYQTLKNNKLNAGDSDIFYDDNSIISRLERLKENIIKQTTGTKPEVTDKVSVADQVDMESILKEYETLKKQVKK